MALSTGMATTIASPENVVQTRFPDRAQVVVIGGGVTGCSVAYRLAPPGWRRALPPDGALARRPRARADCLYAAIWVEQDGCVAPHTATHTLAGTSRGLGAAVLQNSRATGIALDDRRAGRAVLASGGRMEAAKV